jgi:hypothetical protein
MRTAKEIMKNALHEAIDVIQEELRTRSISTSGNDTPQLMIAASNLAIAIFSYEVEAEAMKDSHNQVDDQEDDQNEGWKEVIENG